MSIAPAASTPHHHRSAGQPTGEPAIVVPRVRQQARDAATLMAFSLAASVAVAVGFLLLAVAARQV